MARVVEVNGDGITMRFGGGQVKQWDMSNAQTVQASHYGAEVRFADAERMWIP